MIANHAVLRLPEVASAPVNFAAAAVFKLVEGLLDRVDCGRTSWSNSLRPRMMAKPLRRDGIS